MRVKALLACELSEQARARIAAASPQVALEYRPDRPPAGDFDAVLGGYAPLERARLPRLRWYQLSATGLEHFGDRPAWARGLQITNASGVEAVPVAEYVLAAILDHAQRGAERRALQAGRTWLDPPTPMYARSLRGTTIAIAGYGNLGQEIARISQSFGMRVLACRSGAPGAPRERFSEPGTGDRAGGIPERFVALDEFREIASEADQIVLALPLTPDTRGMLDRNVLEHLRPGVFVVNVGRGALIDEGALIEAVSSGLISGAALDVVENEPLPTSSPLWSLPHTTITPHLAGYVREPVLEALVTENLQRFVDRRTLLNVVDLDRGY